MTEPQAAPPVLDAAAPQAAAQGRLPDTDATPPVAPVAQSTLLARSPLALFLIAACAISMLLAGSLWLKLSNIQEALARQSADATMASVEARTLAKAAQDAAKDMATRQALLETRLNEVALQRSQLEELMQSLSRSRDENLVVDVDSALRLAQQQASLTGSLEPLLAALRSAEQRITRAAQPRLAPLQRAMAKDIDRVKTANVADTPSLLIKLDELVRLVDEMPLANAVATAAKPVKSTAATRSVAASEAKPGTGIIAGAPEWFKQAVTAIREDVKSLVRVSRIDTPEAALLSPEQGFFARENLKLKLLNARLALLSRQFDGVRSDLNTAKDLITRYFDASSRAQQQSQALLTQLQGQLKMAEQPRIDDTLNALTTLSAAAAQGK